MKWSASELGQHTSNENNVWGWVAEKNIHTTESNNIISNKQKHKEIFTSLLLGKNQHIAPARLPRIIPRANSIGPRNILNIRSSKRISKKLRTMLIE